MNESVRYPMKVPANFTPIDRLHARRLFFYLWYMIRKGRNIFFVLFGNIVIGGLLISWLDGSTLAEGQYLALITATTIGYGDLAPETWSARIVAGAIGINGLILTGVFIALTVKALELTYREELTKLEKETGTDDT